MAQPRVRADKLLQALVPGNATGQPEVEGAFARCRATIFHTHASRFPVTYAQLATVLTLV